MDRLFVPLCKEPYENFLSGRKTHELRICGRQYTEKHVYTGRKVELRKGYAKGDSIWGKVGEVIVAPLKEIFEKVPFQNIIPQSDTEEEAELAIRKFMRPSERYIAFEVIPDQDRKT